MTKRRNSQKKLKFNFLRQIILISLATISGVMASAWVLEGLLIHRALELEAEYFWDSLSINPSHAEPRTKHLEGFFESSGGEKLKPFYHLEEGFHEVHFHQMTKILYISEQADQRLYLFYDFENVYKLSLFFGVIPLIMVLAIIYLSSFVTWKSSIKMMSPWFLLAEKLKTTKIGEFHASLPDYSDIDTTDNHEAAVLIEALEAYSKRLVNFVDRQLEFARDASHELRTPLAVIKANLELFAPHQEVSEPVRRIRDTVDDMESLTESLLLWARAENNELPKEEIVVNDLVHNLLERMEPLAQRKAVELHVKQSNFLSVEISEIVLTMALTNLVRNSINYTASGSVTVLIEENSVAVHDTGDGMSTSEFVALIEPFKRGDRVAEQGSGLGLAIVQRLCEKSGWELEVASEAGKGTCVRLVFPAV